MGRERTHVRYLRQRSVHLCGIALSAGFCKLDRGFWAFVARVMGNPGWATGTQKAYLRERIPQYIELRAKRTLSLFWSQLLPEWRSRWPLVLPPDISDDDKEIALLQQSKVSHKLLSHAVILTCGH